jgi:hypothetical protein
MGLTNRGKQKPRERKEKGRTKLDGVKNNRWENRAEFK